MSVRRFLAAALIATGLFPILIFGLIFGPILTGHVREDIRDKANSMLQVIRFVVGSTLLDAAQRDLPSVLIAIKADVGPDAETAFLRDFMLPHEEYRFLAVIDKDGQIEASSSEGIVPARLYQLHEQPILGSVSFSDPFFSAVVDQVVVEAVYANPQKSIVALLDLGAISSRLALVDSTSSDRLAVLDSAGRYIASSDPSKALRLDMADPRLLSRSLKLVKIDSGQFFTISAPITGTSWQIYFAQNERNALEPLFLFMGSLGLLMLFSIISTVSATFIARKNISLPLVELVARIRRIAAGGFDQRIETQSFREFGDIGGAFNDMAESIQSRSEALRRSEERYRILFSRASIPMLIIDPSTGKILDANEASAYFYSYSPEEMLFKSIEELDTSPLPEIQQRMQLILEGRLSHFFLRHRLASEAIRDVEVFARPIDLDLGRALYCVFFDVTDRRLAEERMAKALEERTLLLREVYHRVKNNLQIISSLLNLQVDGIAEPETLRALRVAQDRVYTMSVAHELVYQMEDLSSIRLDEYADRILSNLRMVYGIEEGAMSYDLCTMKLELERAIPFGLALNELASNAFKYAAPSPSHPISIRLEMAQDSRLAVLTVEDSGPGLSAEVQAGGGRKGSLGLSLIGALAKQLGGDARWNPKAGGPGTVVQFRFLAGKD